jgi:hypothetical protein
MEPALTEFSYGYCVTEDFANGMGTGLKAAPYFPSLYAEGKTGGGFDVRIGSALFLQFKLCEELTRRSAKETQMGLLNPPFFRFWLHKRNRSAQHQMLIDLENQPGNQVYYIAPGFAELGLLNAAYTARRVVQDSGLFSPSEMGPLPDDDSHRVSFRLDEDCAWFLSEPRRIRMHRKPGVLDRAMNGSDHRSGAGMEDWLYSLAGRMKEIIHRHNGDEPGSSAVGGITRQGDPLYDIAYLARAYFSCEVLFAVTPR